MMWISTVTQIYIIQMLSELKNNDQLLMLRQVESIFLLLKMIIFSLNTLNCIKGH